MSPTKADYKKIINELRLQHKTIVKMGESFVRTIENDEKRAKISVVIMEGLEERIKSLESNEKTNEKYILENSEKINRNAEATRDLASQCVKAAEHLVSTALLLKTLQQRLFKLEGKRQ